MRSKRGIQEKERRARLPAGAGGVWCEATVSSTVLCVLTLNNIQKEKGRGGYELFGQVGQERYAGCVRVEFFESTLSRAGGGGGAEALAHFLGRRPAPDARIAASPR